jgi:hypothetical protein
LAVFFGGNIKRLVVVTDRLLLSEGQRGETKRGLFWHGVVKLLIQLITLLKIVFAGQSLSMSMFLDKRSIHLWSMLEIHVHVLY